MGASGWQYFMPCQSDINAGLQALRQQAFERGQYYEVPYDDDMNMTEDEMVERSLDEPDPDLREIYLDDLRSKQALPAPTDIDSLLAWNQEAGTHSIIDMVEGVSEKPGFGTVSPLVEKQILEFFNTEHPSHDAVAQWLSEYDIGRIRRRWEGLYIIVYKDGIPDEICFAGFSGD